MVIDFEQMAPGQRYFQTIQTLIPRPIAWVLSEHEAGHFNLAPFSYFSAVCSDPALIMISVGRQADGSHKDTRTNIEVGGKFVVHIPHMAMLEAMNESSATLPPDVSEVERLGLATVPFDGFALPRLRDARVAYGCELHAMHELGNAGQSVIYGEIKQLYVDDAIIDTSVEGRIKVDAASLDPVARLGANEYASIGEVIRLKRPD